MCPSTIVVGRCRRGTFSLFSHSKDCGYTCSPHSSVRFHLKVKNRLCFPPEKLNRLPRGTFDLIAKSIDGDLHCHCNRRAAKTPFAPSASLSSSSTKKSTINHALHQLDSGLPTLTPVMTMMTLETKTLLLSTRKPGLKIITTIPK